MAYCDQKDLSKCPTHLKASLPASEAQSIQYTQLKFTANHHKAYDLADVTKIHHNLVVYEIMLKTPDHNYCLAPQPSSTHSLDFMPTLDSDALPLIRVNIRIKSEQLLPAV